MSNLEQKVREVIGSVETEIKVKDLATDMSFDDAGLDSLDHASILLALQESFEVTIPDELVDGLKSIRQITEFLSGQGKA